MTPKEGHFDANRDLEIAAYPNEHWMFERWEGDYEGTKNPAIIQMDSDKDIAAVFSKRNYPLTIDVVGKGTVTEQVVQQKSNDYPQGTVVKLTAVAAEKWEFVGWQGDLDGNENPATITIDGKTNITAVFEKIEYPLTINIIGKGDVTERVVQAKTTDYPSGTVVELTAVPDSNWTFSKWEGDIESTENPVTIIVDEAKTVTVTFLRTFRLTTIAIPEEGGTIDPSGGDYIKDTSFDVEAIPNEGWKFVEWRGDFTGTTNPFNLTMNGNKTLEAYFEALSFTLSTTTVGNGQILEDLLNGSETDDGYTYNSEVELTAVPDNGWRFVRWEGDLTGDANPALLTMDRNKSVTAVFDYFDAGSGTADDPYEISDICQVQNINNYLDSYFLLTQDIDASGISECNGGAGFTPVGDETDPFTGGFDGNGFKIMNLTINQPLENYVGLLGYSSDGAIIQNVTLTNVNISGGNHVGSLAGQNDGEVLNSSGNGSVNGSLYIGGLVGENTGIIQQSGVSGSVGDGSSFIVGGLVGQNSGMGQISESYSNATITGDTSVGGLVGRNFNGSPHIEKSYALGDVTGTDSVGGLVGTNSSDTGLVSEAFASGEVSGLTNLGGLIGSNTVTATVEFSYWDTELLTGTGQAIGAGSGDTTGMTGLTTTQMTGAGAETNMPDFDWMNTWTTTPADYPILQWQE